MWEEKHLLPTPTLGRGNLNHLPSMEEPTLSVASPNMLCGSCVNGDSGLSPKICSPHQADNGPEVGTYSAVN